MSKQISRARLGISLVCLAMLLALIPPPARAQVSTAQVNGTVKDQSGAVVPGANLSLRNLDTGVTRETRTTGTGYYILTQVRPGRYTLEVSKRGFARTRVANIILMVNQSATYDVMLRVGTASQAVTVTATPAEVNTSTVGLGAVVDQREVNNLPLNGRNFTELLTLVPGSSPLNVDQNSSNGVTSFLGYRVGEIEFPAVNGQSNRSNLFLVDGLNDEGVMGSNYAVAPIMDDIQEFKVQSDSTQAQFGGVTGAVVNVVTKSGTNQFHGGLWEFLRNSALDARDPFFASVTPYVQNQFGGDFGGPVLLPHYNGRNRTFFFASYEGFRSSEGSQELYAVPTAAELNGDFSSVPTGAALPIYNPFTTRTDPTNPSETIRTPFTDDQIPTTLIDPGMVKYAEAFFPKPVYTGVAGYNGLDNAPTITKQDEFNGRIDDRLNNTNSFWGRYTAYHLPATGPGGFQGLNEVVLNKGQNWGVGYLHTFGPSTALQVEFGRTFDTANTGSVFSSTPAGILNSVGINPQFDCGYFAGYVGNNCLVPSVAISSYLGGGDTIENNIQSNFYQYSADLTTVKGNHTFGAGFDLYTTSYNSIDLYVDDGFEAEQTDNPESPGNTGNAMASYVLSVPYLGEFRNALEEETGTKIVGAYLQDQWKATPRLSADLGLRYDVTLIPPYGEVVKGLNIGAVGDMNFNNGTYELQLNPGLCSTVGKAPCIPGTGLPAHVVVSSNGKIVPTVFNNIQPRVGLAYRLNDKTALHGSFGIFYDNWENYQQLLQNIGSTWPDVAYVDNPNLNPSTGVPTVTGENPLPNSPASLSGVLPAANPFLVEAGDSFFDPNWQNPMSKQWVLGIERQLSANTDLTVNYVGNSDKRLWMREQNGGAPLTPGPGPVASRALYPYITPVQYDTSLGSGNYNALQVSLRHYYGSGLSYLLSYTWSKSIDIGCSDRENCSVEDPYDRMLGRGVSTFDLPQDFTASVTYNLPFGERSGFRVPNRVFNQAIRGWQVNSIVTLTSGEPYTLLVEGDVANTDLGSERVNQIGPLSVPNQTTAGWFDTKAVEAPPDYTYGTMGRNMLTSDGYQDVDFSIFRSFPIHKEADRLEFRAEFFNFLNWPTWGVPGTTINESHFGQVTSTRSTQREIQFALKFYF
jgi:hypothetical protein